MLIASKRSCERSFGRKMCSAYLLCEEDLDMFPALLSCSPTSFTYRELVTHVQGRHLALVSLAAEQAATLLVRQVVVERVAVVVVAAEQREVRVEQSGGTSQSQLE